MDIGRFACAVLLEFRKTFDTVNHVIWKTLDLYGIREITTKNYLSRTQSIFPQFTSDIEEIHYGVAHGSILRYLIFNMHRWFWNCLSNNCQLLILKTNKKVVTEKLWTTFEMAWWKRSLYCFVVNKSIGKRKFVFEAFNTKVFLSAIIIDNHLSRKDHTALT